MTLPPPPASVGQPHPEDDFCNCESSDVFTKVLTFLGKWFLEDIFQCKNPTVANPYLQASCFEQT